MHVAECAWKVTGTREWPGTPGKYTPEQGAVYGKACKRCCDSVTRPRERARTALKALADQSPVARGQEVQTRHGHGTAQYLLHSNDCCEDLVGEAHLSSPLQPCGYGHDLALGKVVQAIG